MSDFGVGSKGAAAVLLGAALLGGTHRSVWGQTAGQATPQAPPLQVKPPPIPTGVVPLPSGPPPTTLQAPLPSPALPPPPKGTVRLVSPGMAQLGAALAGHPITITDAVAIALATNRDLASAVSALLRAEGRTSEARAALNPTFALGAAVTEFSQATNASFGGMTIPIIPQFNPVLTAQANLPIDISGTLRAATTQAQFSEAAARIGVNRARNQLVLNVKSAFYNVLRAQAQLRVALDNQNNALRRWSSAQKNYAAGISPRFDVITSQTDVANAQQSRITAESQVSLALARLKNTMGIDIRTPLQITDAGAVETPPGVTPPAAPAATAPPPAAEQPIQSAPPALAPPSAAIPPDLQTPPSTTGVVTDPIDLGPQYDSLLQEAYRTRPEILQADAQVAAAKKGITVARRSELPSLAFSIGYTYTPDAVGFTLPSQGAAVLNASLPIFDGGAARARVREAEAEVGAAETDRRTAIDQVGLDVQQAYLTLIQARDRVQVANVGLTQAREAARLAQVRYNAGVSQQTGVSPIIELSNAQTSLTQAEVNQVNALYDYNEARAELDRAVGRYSSAASTGAEGNRKEK